MRILRWARRALVSFIGAYLFGISMLWLTDRPEIAGPAFWLCVLVVAGAAGASVVALAVQLILALRIKEGERAHG